MYIVCFIKNRHPRSPFQQSQPVSIYIDNETNAAQCTPRGLPVPGLSHVLIFPCSWIVDRQTVDFRDDRGPTPDR